MPRALSDGICAAVKSDLESGILDLKTLQSRHGISGSKARSMKQRFLTTGEVINTNKKRPTGRKRKLTKEQEQSLRLFLEDHPDSYLKEMCKFMEDLYGVRVNESTMQRTCGRIGWKLKQQPRPRDDLGFWVRTLPRDEEGNPIRGITPATKRPADYGTRLSYTKRRDLMAKTREWVQKYMSQPQFDASHDYSHVQRVLALCFQLLRVEQKSVQDRKYDGLVVELVALMHDIDDHKYRHRRADEDTEGYPTPPSTMGELQVLGAQSMNPFAPFDHSQAATVPPSTDPNNPAPSAPSVTPEMFSQIVENSLLEIGWPPFITAKVAAIVPFISHTAETSHAEAFAAAFTQYPEIAIVQDADRLDAIGATGIGRAFAYTGAKDREGGMAATLDHFRTKLVNLEARMKTGEGRRLAIARTERLRTFGRWWFEEMRMIDAEVGDMSWVQDPALQAPSHLGCAPVVNPGSSSDPVPGPPIIQESA